MSTENQAQYLNDLAYTCFAEAERIGFDRSKYPNVQTIMANMKSKEASKLIDAFVKYLSAHWNWRPGSKQTVVAEFSYQWARTWNYAFINKSHYVYILNWIRRDLGLDLQSKDFRPLIFTQNVNGSRVPVDIETAEQQFLKQCGIMKGYVNDRLRKNHMQNDGIDDTRYENEHEEQEKEEIRDDEIREFEQEEQQEEDDDKLPTEAEVFWNRYVELREYTSTRNVGGHQVDTLERRPLIAGAKMLIEDIPVEAIVHAMTMHWPESDRRELNIPEYDVRTFKPENRIPGLPPEFPYLDALYRQRINPWLISAAGVGKTTVVGKVANHYEQPWCAIPLNRGTAPSAFNGRPKVTNTSTMVRFLKAMANQDEEAMNKIANEAERDGDVTISEFTKIFRDGGHILLDEIDAGDESLLMIVNMPLANGRFVNTAEGKTYEIHPDTLIWAASNTMGLGVSAGSGREYRARNALDFATIDRFRMGRVKMEGDIDDYRNMYEDIILAYS